MFRQHDLGFSKLAVDPEFPNLILHRPLRHTQMRGQLCWQDVRRKKRVRGHIKGLISVLPAKR